MIFNGVDWAILVIVFASSGISLFRGFVREVCSLMTWIAAVIVTWMFRDSFADAMVEYVLSPTVRIMLASFILFAGTLIVGGLVNSGVVKLVRMTGLARVDRSLGIVFGGLRGLLLVTVAVSIAAHTTIIEEGWWQTSTLIPYFEESSNWLIGLVSDTLGPAYGS